MAGHWALTGLSPCSVACSWLWPGLEVLQPSPTLTDGVQPLEKQSETTGTAAFSASSDQGGKNKEKEKVLERWGFLLFQLEVPSVRPYFPPILLHLPQLP